VLLEATASAAAGAGNTAAAQHNNSEPFKRRTADIQSLLQNRGYGPTVVIDANKRRGQEASLRLKAKLRTKRSVGAENVCDWTMRRKNEAKIALAAAY
jgi:hypothetical protein